MISVTRHRSVAGFTIIELLAGAFITVVVAAAGLRFYANMHGAALAQSDISEMQQLCRSSIQEIQRTLSQAGFKVPPGHPPFEVRGDTLAVYFNNIQPVDTVLYYLEEFTSSEYDLVPGLPVGQKLYKLMKKTNSAAASIYADYVKSVAFVSVTPSTMAVTVTVYSARRDETYAMNDGFRTYTLGETVKMRNLS